MFRHSFVVSNFTIIFVRLCFTFFNNALDCVLEELYTPTNSAYVTRSFFYMENYLKENINLTVFLRLNQFDIGNI